MTGSIVLRRIVASITALLAAVGAFAAGFLVADARSGEPPAYRLATAGLDAGLSCDRLRGWYVDHAVDQVTAWGWQSPVYAEAIPLAGGFENDSAGAPRASSPDVSLDTRTGSDTGTNVQEADVDEPDIAKVAGDLLVRIDNGVLRIDDLSGSEPRRLGVAPLDLIGDPQLLLSGERAVVVGTDVEGPAAGFPRIAPWPRTWVRTYDLGDPADPTLVDSRQYDGSLVTARQVGNAVRLVLDAGLPSLDFTQPSSTVTEHQALAHNRRVVRDSTAADWLPGVTTYGDRGEDSRPTVDCADVSVPETFNGIGTLTIVGFDPSDPTATEASAVTTASDTAYMSSSHLYVAMAPWSHLSSGWGPLAAGGTQATRIYGFDLFGTSARYVGMGTVDGTVGGSWSMDEHDGVLRVAVTSPGDLDGRPPATSVVTLRPESGRLLDVGRLDGLGVGQQLKAVRWFDEIAVLVTFEQVDPFYVVDVADPAALRVLGELHLPGWSSYLHPVGPHLVLGLGQTSAQDVVFESPRPQATLPTIPPVRIPPKPLPDSGGTTTTAPEPVDPPTWWPPVVRQQAKATLFDIADLAHPRDVDTVSYPNGSVPMAATEPHQVTWLPDRQTLLTVIGSGFGSTTYGGSQAWISILTVDDGQLGSRLLPLPEGTPVNNVRTLPMPDGRVILVAGDSVQFLTV